MASVSRSLGDYRKASQSRVTIAQQDELDEHEGEEKKYARAVVSLWFLYFAGLGQALGNFTQCTGDINGHHYLTLGTIYPCSTSQVPASLLLTLLLFPSLFVLFTVYLDTCSAKFFDGQVARLFRLAPLRDWVKDQKPKHPVAATFFDSACCFKGTAIQPSPHVMELFASSFLAPFLTRPGYHTVCIFRGVLLVAPPVRLVSCTRGDCYFRILHGRNRAGESHAREM